MSRIASKKPAKPYPDFPLTAHPNGQWCKKIRGRVHYFGPWADPQAALRLFKDQQDDLYAGRKPRQPGSDDSTLRYALNHFLSAKKLAQESGEITARSYLDYEKTCDRIAASIGKYRQLSDIQIADLQRLRRDLAKGAKLKKQKGRRRDRGVNTIKNDLTRARMFFLYVNDYLVDKPIKYRKALASPPKRQIRKAANECGERMFEAAEIRRIVAAASPQLKAMTLLGLNCGFGPHDCGTLPIDKLDLANGWHYYGRPKTHNKRRCPLWPETVAALREVLADRPEPAEEGWGGLVFLTPVGGCWSDEDTGYNEVSPAFRKLLKELDIYQKNVKVFYSLRRTFETIGATANEQLAVDFVMGHIGTDMASVYRQKTFNAPLLKVTNHVRDWYLGLITLD
ncbi:MAG TPA: tyrosine-type recombinase/integrase [Pirellulales bacterium]|nr:tyrosine-type recombinase/integrase [Pirellulales bacterium]